METLHKDVVELITNKLSPKDFVNYCKVLKGICLNKDIWTRRLRKDFPYLFRDSSETYFLKIKYFKGPEIFDFRRDPKRAYLALITHTFETAEYITRRILDALGREFQDFLRPDYKEYVENFFVKYLLEAINFDEKEFDSVEYFYYNNEWENFIPSLYLNNERSDYWVESIQSLFDDYIKSFSLENRI